MKKIPFYVLFIIDSKTSLKCSAFDIITRHINVSLNLRRQKLNYLTAVNMFDKTETVVVVVGIDWPWPLHHIVFGYDFYCIPILWFRICFLNFPLSDVGIDPTLFNNIVHIINIILCVVLIENKNKFSLL